VKPGNLAPRLVAILRTTLLRVPSGYVQNVT
jgi:hypothetical protein